MVRRLWTKLRRDLRRQKAQFGAVVLTLFLGVALFGASYDAFQNLQASYQRLYTRLRFADLTVTGGAVSDLQAQAQRLGVQAATTRTVADDVPLRVDPSRKLLVRLIGLPVDQQPAVNQVLIQSGTYLDPARPTAVLVERHMADHFHLRPGDTLQLGSSRGPLMLTVVGVAASPEYLWPARSRQDILTSLDDFGVLFVPEQLVQDVAGDAATHQALFFIGAGHDGAALTSQLRGLAARAGAADIMDRAEQPSHAALQEDVSGFNELALLFPVLFLSAAGLASYVLLTRLVTTQRAQIGTLLATGCSGRALLVHYLGYGVVAGAAGALPGAVAGALLARGVTGLYTSAIGVPIRVIGFHPFTPLLGIVFGVGAGMAAAAAPAIAAFRLTPAEAMRGAAPTGSGHSSLIERLVSPLRRLPAGGKLVLRGISRNRRRTGSTMVGVILALTLILISWGMLDTTNTLLSRQFEHIQRQDARVVFAGVPTTATLVGLRQVDGIAVVEPSAELDAVIGNGTGQYATTLVALPQKTSMHRFFLAGGDHTDRLPDDGIFVGVALRRILGVKAGDALELHLPAQDVTLSEPVAGFVEEPLGTYAYISLVRLQAGLKAEGAASAGSHAAAFVDSAPSDSALVQYAPGVDRALMRQRLARLPNVAAVMDAKALQQTVRSFMGLFNAFVGVMLVFGAMMAFALMFNTMSVNIAERSVELATLRAEGASAWTLGRLVAAENMLVAALGVVPGLLIGYLVARQFMASYTSDLFRFDLALRPSTPVFAALAILVVALFAQWPGLRAISRLDVARLVRDRSL